jgi:carbon-monoxide dehydrogenase medium subunit
MPMMLRLLDGKVVARGPEGERVIDAADFFVGLLTTSLKADEILTAVRFPFMPIGAGYAVEEFARRHGDFAIVAVSAMITPRGKGLSARLAAVGIESFPVRLHSAEDHIEREGIDDASIDEATRIVADLANAPADRHASAEYRRRLASVLSGRALRRARALMN